MVDRDDLTFATCHQLAGVIKENWDSGITKQSDLALRVLSTFDDPVEGRAVALVEKFGDVKSSSAIKAEKINALMVCAESLKLILSESDGWNDDNADTIKKEMLSRIKDYENRVKTLVAAVPQRCFISI